MYKHLAVLLTFIICMLSCIPNKKKEDAIRVAILRGPSAIAFAKWIDESSTLNKKTFNITINDSPEKVQAALIKNEADIAVLPMISAANLYNKGIDYKLAGCPLWGTLFLVGKEPTSTLHLFGTGTTPDILTRHYLKNSNLDYQLNYSFASAMEVTQALLAGKAEAGVLSEPFVSMVLKRDPSLKIIADLNNPNEESMGFAQTAIMIRSSLKEQQTEIDQLIIESCEFAITQPKEVIRILEEAGVFPEKMLSEESIKRNKIHYLPAKESEEEIFSFLKVIESYEPKAIGGKLPDRGFIYGKP